MTRAEWDALEPRKRGALVAEKVMGWTMAPDGFWVSPTHWDPEDGYGPARAPEDWSPTTSLDAMQEVVEKMEAEGRTWSIHRTEGSPTVCAVVDPLILPGVSATAPTAPEAVCIAAMTARGHMDAP